MVVTSPWEVPLFCYAILEVDPEADDETINEAYRRLVALRYSKRRGTSDFETTEFHRLIQAHKVLSNPHTRRRYDVQILTGLQALESDRERIRRTLDDLEAGVARASRDFLSRVHRLEDTKQPQACRTPITTTVPTTTVPTEMEGNPRLNDYISLLATSRRDGRPPPPPAAAARQRRREYPSQACGCGCGGGVLHHHHRHHHHTNSNEEEEDEEEEEEEVRRAEAGTELARQAVHSQYILIHRARRELAVANAELERVRRERNGRFKGVKGGVGNKEEDVEEEEEESDDGEGGNARGGGGYPECVSWEE